MIITLTEDVDGCYGRKYVRGERVEYYPWPYEWRGMSEPERIAKGIFVICLGHGEFDVLKGSADNGSASP